MAKSTGFPDTTSPGAMSIVNSAIKTGLIMAATIVGTAASLIAFWRLTCYVGRPLGNLLVADIPPPETVPAKSPEEVKVWQVKARNIFGGLIGVLMWFAALMVESISITVEKQRTEVTYPWTFWLVVVLVAKAGLEALVAVSMTSGLVRVARMG